MSIPKSYSYETDWRQYAFPEDENSLASEEELKEKYTPVRLARDSPIKAGGMPVLCDGKTAWLNTDNEMTLVYGATGTKKTRALIAGLIANLALAEESMIILDVKSEFTSGIFAPRILGILREKGYRIRVLNFRTLDGDGFDLLGTIYARYRAGNRMEAMMQLHMLIDRMAGFYKGSSADPIWAKKAKEYLMAVAVLLFELCDEKEKVNLLSLASYTDRESVSNLERAQQMFPQNDNILVMLRSVLAEPDKTRMSTLATVSSFFSDLILNEKLLKMLSTSTFQPEELYRDKTALFLVLPDETDAYLFATGLILSQISSFLTGKATEMGGQLPRRVNYICDEFCNYYITGMDKNISAHRSRNIRWYLVCQGKKQLKKAYPAEYGTILDNCTNLYFTGSPDMDLLEELSQRAGYTNISEDGKPRRRITTENLKTLQAGREYSEVYFSSGRTTCVTILADIDQYEFLNRYTESVRLPVRSYEELQIYTSEQMLQDVYHRYHKKEKS